MMAEEKNGSLELMRRCIQKATELTGQFREYSPEAIAIIAAELHRTRSHILVAKYPVGMDMETQEELLEVMQDIQHGGVGVIPNSIELHSGEVVEIEVKIRDKEGKV